MHATVTAPVTTPVTVAWVSRHPMTTSQVEDLARILGVNAEDVIVSQVNLTWAASPDAAADVAANCFHWEQLAAGAFTRPGKPLVVAGVFPLVALEALAETDFSVAMAPSVLTPVSRQAPELRASPDAPIPFTHVRWVKLA